jgi:hypothetical protein
MCCSLIECAGSFTLMSKKQRSKRKGVASADELADVRAKIFALIG